MTEPTAREPLDWVRVSFVGAILGGALWAVLTVVLSLLGHGHSTKELTFGFLFGVSAVVLGIGWVICRRGRSSSRRALGAGLMLGVLVGWLVLLLVVVVALLPAHFAGRP